jgi:hypothetical protein
MGINVFPEQGGSDEINPMLIDPVSKFRVSNPENLIDTDFEYGLQPTKWETVEIINNTPAFFSKGGDTTIPDITGITTNGGTREITVTTAFPHGLAVGVPIRVDGTKSVTADGSYIINATPSLTSFTYLSRANQSETLSIFDLYTSIITGEFFQGSQISISDSAGITTDGEGPISELTVKTKNKHGFGLNTPFYFLNLNSTISQEFEAQNTASVSFDPTNSAVAQTFDGSNTQNQTPIDFSNSASTAVVESPVTSIDSSLNTITVSMNGASWAGIKVGDPLYYDVSAVSGYFKDNPRGVVFIKIVFGVGTTNSTFQVSELPNGSVIPITSGMSGFFQLADQAKTFPGNNVDQESQIELFVEVGEEFVFDGGNQGYLGPEQETPPDNTLTVSSYNGTQILASGTGPVEYYVGTMLKYTTTGNAATGLVNNATYFVTDFNNIGDGDFDFRIAELPGGSLITISGGTGTQAFSPIGVSIDKDIVHIRDSNFDQFDMVEYSFPIIVDEDNPDETVNGNFESNKNSKFYFLVQKYDQHNYKLNNVLGLVLPETQTRTGTDAGTAIVPTEVILDGFTEPLSWSVTSGVLPAGLVLNTSTGVVSGTPQEETLERTVVITVTDVNGITGSQSITFQFNPRPEIYAFTSATFTNGTYAPGDPDSGPTLAQIRGGLGNPSWANTYLRMVRSGIVLWTVPATGPYRITAAGARGGVGRNSITGGFGAQMAGTFTLEEGSEVQVFCGEQGHPRGGVSDGDTQGGGGGGMSGVALSNNTPLIVAGGGGGGGDGGGAGGPGINTIRGNGNSGGSGQYGGGGGGGWTGNGSGSGSGDNGGRSFTNGLSRPPYRYTRRGTTFGSFGGGGGGDDGDGRPGAGGGGYGGGNGGASTDNGGGSFNSGTNQQNLTGSNPGQGFVTIERL